MSCKRTNRVSIFLSEVVLKIFDHSKSWRKFLSVTFDIVYIEQISHFSINQRAWDKVDEDQIFIEINLKEFKL